MSPEIRRDGILVADVPDVTGLHQMLDGSPLYVDVSGIDAHQKSQRLILEGPAIGGRRIIGLTLEGLGDTAKRKRNGDQKEPRLEVSLKERPIRVTYSAQEGYRQGEYRYGPRESQYNPKWMRTSGRR